MRTTFKGFEIEGSVLEISELIRITGLSQNRGNSELIKPVSIDQPAKTHARKPAGEKKSKVGGKIKREKWQHDQVARLKAEYSHKTISELVAILGKSKGSINTKIIQLKNAGEI